MTFLTWILAGLLAGLLAGWVMTRGGYGLKWEITLGIVGSIGGSLLLRTLWIVAGEATEMKVAERVEKGSDRIVTAAKLTGTLRLKNTSTNQTVRLLEGKLRYIDAQGQPIKLEDARSEPTLKFATYGSERLDPGQEAIQSLDVEFPAEALKAKRLKEIRLEFAYIPSSYREETVNFAVSVGAGK